MRVAILIDGGYFLKRLPSIRKDLNPRDVQDVANGVRQLISGHLSILNKIANVPNPRSLLYRCFFYDASPYMQRGHLPISKKAIDYGKSEQAEFRRSLFEELRKIPHFAVRLGEVHLERNWILNEKAQKDLLKKRRTVDDLTDADFSPGFRQKTVDMRIGTDIASITLKKQADTIVLIAGDSDFVPVAKLARREGMHVILDPLKGQVKNSIFEHVDHLYCGYKDDSSNDTPN